mmetsp:Transcript_29990/g.65649  ORF Transcript_29990/g.65649 Transcript_29990/m.65649 type:complete len:246 (+) Transcript_29990:873-1610(+)
MRCCAADTARSPTSSPRRACSHLAERSSELTVTRCARLSLRDGRGRGRRRRRRRRAVVDHVVQLPLVLEDDIAELAAPPFARHLHEDEPGAVGTSDVETDHAELLAALLDFPPVDGVAPAALATVVSPKGLQGRPKRVENVPVESDLVERLVENHLRARCRGEESFGDPPRASAKSHGPKRDDNRRNALLCHASCPGLEGKRRQVLLRFVIMHSEPAWGLLALAHMYHVVRRGFPGCRCIAGSAP